MRPIYNNLKAKKPSSWRWWLIGLATVILLVVGSVWGLRIWYHENLKPVSTSQKTVYFTVPIGSGVQEVAAGLHKAGLIRNIKAFETYVRSNELYADLQAGTYALSPSMSVAQIVKKIVQGDVAKNLLTILPGKSLEQIKEAFKSSGYSQAAIDEAFQVDKYRKHPALADLAPNGTLEGYLYPDSFQKLSDTPAETIIRQSLDEMDEYLSPDVKKGFAAQGLSVYQGIVLASIVEKEVPHDNDRPIVAQVFLKRLRENIKLESDATSPYYNTYNKAGLPPMPISNVTVSSLRAVAYPANTNYLFFVSGDDGVTHFSYTKAEHEEATRKYCTELCRP